MIEVLLIATGLASAISMVLVTANRGRARMWGRVAKRLSLAPLRGNARDLTGHIDGFDVRIYPAPETQAVGDVANLVRSAELHDQIQIGLRSRWRSLPLEHVASQDPVFDDVVVMMGPPAVLFACLDAETRGVIEDFVRRGNGGISSGVVRSVSRTRSAAEPEERLVRTMLSTIKVARRLIVAADDIPHRLAANAINDPVVEVRRRCLEILIDGYPGTSECLEACRAALGAEDIPLRIMGAGQLGEEGVLHAIARDESNMIGHRIEAIDTMVRRVSAEDVGALIDVVRGWSHPAALDALARLGDATDEPRLLGFLTDDSSAHHDAACRALARVGTIAAVEQLLSCPSHEAKAAIAAIQGRAGEVDDGRLSIVGGSDEGGLSVVNPGAELQPG